MIYYSLVVYLFLSILFFLSQMKQCQSCGMPLVRDPSGQGWGTEKDWSISSEWCSLCYKDGQFVWWTDMTLSQMQTIVDNAMKAQWFWWFMRTLVKLQMPYLARWKSVTPQQIRFVRKTYGWGRTPATWQGRVATFLYVVAIVCLTFRYGWTENQPPTEEMWTTLVVGMAVATLLLLVVCYMKGESPKWQRGTKKK